MTGISVIGRSELARESSRAAARSLREAVALVQGLAGLGKTALAAEALHLWHTRFNWVLAFQAKPTLLTVDGFYQNPRRSG